MKVLELGKGNVNVTQGIKEIFVMNVQINILKHRKMIHIPHVQVRNLCAKLCKKRYAT